MAIKTILVSQPKPQSNRSPYFDLAERQNLKIDFVPFIKVEGVALKNLETKESILETLQVFYLLQK